MKENRGLKTKNRLKPTYKPLLKLRENVLNSKKLFNFKREKWQKLIKHSQRKFKRYKKFKQKDQLQYLITKYPNRGVSYKKKYRDTLQAAKRLNLFYGGFSKKVLKKRILDAEKNPRNYEDKRYLLLKYFESRLDSVLYRARFSVSMRQARQLILHSKVFVNQKVMKSKSFQLKTGDIVSVNLKYSFLVIRSLHHLYKNKQAWPFPPKHLTVNYKTLQIVFGEIKNTNFATNTPFNLQLERVMQDFRRQ